MLELPSLARGDLSPACSVCGGSKARRPSSCRSVPSPQLLLLYLYGSASLVPRPSLCSCSLGLTGVGVGWEGARGLRGPRVIASQPRESQVGTRGPQVIGAGPGSIQLPTPGPGLLPIPGARWGELWGPGHRQPHWPPPSCWLPGAEGRVQGVAWMALKAGRPGRALARWAGAHVP